MELYYLLRVIVAGLCGLLIGYERKNRMKEAGVRTHFVVAVGASLMMVLSKYGFQDQIGWDNLGLDPSRIAAQVVSGVGFLGAGMIFMQRNTIKGLTTAAGVWATAGIGMAIGAGLYWVGGGATVVLLLAQLLLHGRPHLLNAPRTEQVTVVLEEQPGSVDRVQTYMQESHMEIVSFHAEHKDSEWLLELVVKLPHLDGKRKLLSMVEAVPGVRTVEVH